MYLILINYNYCKLPLISFAYEAIHDNHCLTCFTNERFTFIYYSVCYLNQYGGSLLKVSMYLHVIMIIRDENGSLVYTDPHDTVTHYV